MNEHQKLVPMLDPAGVGAIAVVIGPILVADGGANLPPLIVVADADHDVAVGSLKDAIGNDLRMFVSPSARTFAGHQDTLHDIDQAGQRAIGQSHVKGSPRLATLAPKSPARARRPHTSRPGCR